MLAARRSFVDDDAGPVLAGVTRVADDHPLAHRWPERFELLSSGTESERSGAGGDCIRQTNMTLGMVEGQDETRIVGLMVPYGYPVEISEFGQRFKERFAAGSLTRSLAEDRMPLLLEHGQDPRLGKRPVGKPTRLWDDAAAARFEGQLLVDDKDVRDHVLPGIRAGLYGASVRFKPTMTDVSPPKRGERLELRTIREARLREISVTSLAAYPTSVTMA
jgi:phage head maturation protease